MSDRPAGPQLRLTASLEGDDSKPVLVLGNSLGTSRGIWDPQLPALAGHFRLLRYELPGHGDPAAGSGIGNGAAASAGSGVGARSAASAGPRVSTGASSQDPPPGPYSLGDLGAAVLALLDEHRIDRAIYCGISLGGMIGMWLAAHAPDRVAALGLCCTSAYLPPASGWLDRARLVRTAGMAAVTGAALGRWFTPPFVRSAPAVTAKITAMLAGAVPEGYAGCCEAIAAMDLRPVLGAITAPTLVIAATEDPVSPPPHGALIARQVSGARLIVVRGASHLANVQAPGPVTAALRDHLLASRP